MTVAQRRILDRVAMMPDGCWIWTNYVGSHGYGVICIQNPGKPILAHRLSYEAFIGPIPDGLTIDHLCRQPLCVNPAHLEPVTQGENTRRGISPVAVNAVKTHCKRGHEFTPSNTYMQSGPYGEQRICRACHVERQRAYRERKAMA